MNLKFATLFLVLHFSLTAIPSFAQPNFFKMWDNVYGGNDDDILSAILCDKSGNIYSIGSTKSDSSGNITQSSHGYFDFWVVKSNPAGAILWDRRLGGAGQDLASAAILDSSGNLLVAGVTSSPLSGDVEQPPYGNYDYWAVLLDSNGNKLWSNRFGGSSADNLWAVTNSADGGFLLGGSSASGISGVKTEPNKDPGKINADIWLVKINAAGNKIWDRDIGTVANDDVFNLASFEDGSYLLAGHSDTAVDHDKTSPAFGDIDFWVLKINASGTVQWDKTYGGSGYEGINIRIDTTNGNGFVLAGLSFSDSSGNKYMQDQADFWVIRCDSNGAILWENSYGGDGPDEISTIQVVEEGNILLTGISASWYPSGEKTEANFKGEQAWIIKVNASGQKLWDKTIFTDRERGITGGIELPDGCYIVGESSDSRVDGYKTHPSFTAPDSSIDYWLMKFCMGSVDVPTLPTGLGLQLNIYPSPFTNDLTIALSNNPGTAATYTITNTAGQILYYRQEVHIANTYTKILDLSPLPSGIYFVTVEVGNQKTVKQVVKQ